MIQREGRKAVTPVDTRSLKFEFLSRSLMILTILLALIGTLQYIFMQAVIYRNQATSIQSQIMSVPPHVWEELLNQGNNETPPPPMLLLPEMRLALIDEKGNYLELENLPNGTEPVKLKKQDYLELLQKPPGSNYSVVDSAKDGQQLVVLQPIPNGLANVRGVIQASVSTSSIRELLFGQLLTFLGLAVLALLFGYLFFLPVLQRTFIPLFRLVETAEQIDAGNLDWRFSANHGQLEIARLAESFNGMLERLEASFKAERETKDHMRRFVADASHELRTPLTAIHGFVEVLIRGAVNDPVQLQKALHSMKGESTRVIKLVNDLLLLAKLDGVPHLELEECFLDEIFFEMEPQLRIIAGARLLQLQIEPKLACQLDQDKWKQVILNLFQNAVQHTDPEKGEIRMALHSKDNWIHLSVQDNGEGISAIHLPYVFERFYRSDSSRTRKYGGSGLGLAIIKSIVEAHGGTIQVESQDGEGARFYVRMPCQISGI